MAYFDGRLAEMHDKQDELIPELYRPNSDINVYRKDNIGSLLPKQSRVSRWGNLVDDTLAILKKVNPSVIVAPHPQLNTPATTSSRRWHWWRRWRVGRRTSRCCSTRTTQIRIAIRTAPPGRSCRCRRRPRRRAARSRLFAPGVREPAAHQAVCARVDARPAVHADQAISAREG